VIVSASAEEPLEARGQPHIEGLEGGEAIPPPSVLDRFTSYIAGTDLSLAELSAQGQPRVAQTIHEFLIYDISIANQKRQAQNYPPITALRGKLIESNIEWVGGIRNSEPHRLVRLQNRFSQFIKAGEYRYPQIRVTGQLASQIESIGSPAAEYANDLLIAYGKSVAELKH
jgi:hypothetical protein